MRDYLRDKDIWDWQDQFSLHSIPLPSFLTIPLTQSNNTVLSTPIIDNRFTLESMPLNNESFTYESFPLQEFGQTIVIIAGVAVVVYAGACVIGAFLQEGKAYGDY